MANLGRYNILDLKEALSRNIDELRKKYKYTGISAYSFDAYVDKSLNSIIKTYSSNSNLSLDDFFKNNIEMYMGKYIREKIIFDNRVISSYVNNTEVDINDASECVKCLEEISKIYKISLYEPSYIMINSLLNIPMSKNLNGVLSNFCSNLTNYKEFPDSIKTMVEVYCDRNNIDLISIILNDEKVKFDKIEELSKKVDSGNNKYLFEFISLKKSVIDSISKLFDITDKKQIEDLFNDATRNCNSNKPKGGFLLNNIRRKLRMINNKSYEIEEFINRYNKHVEFASLDDFILPLNVLKKGLYKYLNENSNEVIEKVISELPPKYLMILHNAYGKSLRYINYNENLAPVSQKRLSVILITIRDYIRYKNKDTEMIPESIRESENTIYKIDFNEAIQNLKDAGYDSVFSKLNELERIVVMLKMGIVNNREYSNEEISSFLGIEIKDIISILINYLTIYKDDIVSNIDNCLKEYKKIK